MVYRQLADNQLAEHQSLTTALTWIV